MLKRRWGFGFHCTKAEAHEEDSLFSARFDQALICPVVNLLYILHIHTEYTGKYVNDDAGVSANVYVYCMCWEKETMSKGLRGLAAADSHFGQKPV